MAGGEVVGGGGGGGLLSRGSGCNSGLGRYRSDLLIEFNLL